MKTELKAKFLQNILSKKKENEGFTLIELLVVIIIIGILSAIALPAFLNQANKARASEAKTYIGSINRAQQAYVLENPDFVTAQANFAQLELGISTQTENYTYTIAQETTINGVSAKAIPTTTQTAKLKGYIGSTAVATTTGTGEATTIAILCETLAPILAGDTTNTGIGAPTNTGGNITGLNCDATTQKQVR
ncbi:MAG: type IV pilin-like G/H family protein [Cyanobacteria bacterium P01_H01_bin.150]